MLAMEDTKSSSSAARATEPENTLYNRSLFDPELRGSRKLLIQTLVLPITYTSLLMWGCLSLYWGSTVSSNLHKLTVYAIDLDGGQFGQQMLQGINASITNPPRDLGWRFDNGVISDAMSKHLVLNEQAWAVVQGIPQFATNQTLSLPSQLILKPLPICSLPFVQAAHLTTLSPQ